jgi:hypothetical protein
MRINKQIVFSSGFPAVIGWTLIAGCSTRNDAISQAEKTEMDHPDVAEERLIYDEASYDYVEDLDWLKPAATTKPIAPPK